MTRKEFTRLRSVFWPIHRQEFGSVVGLMVIFFFCSFSYHLLRQIKDNLILVVTRGGMEVVPFIKGWMLLPLSFFAVCLFAASEKFLREKTTLAIIISLFCLYFSIFFLWIYPNREILECTFLASFLENAQIPGIKGMILMVRHWHVSIFYVISELWGTIIIHVALWGFVNNAIPIQDARRIYGCLNFAINFSGVLASFVSVHFLFNQELFFSFLGKSRWEQGFKLSLLLILISGFIALLALKNLSFSSWKKEPVTKKIDSNTSFYQHLCAVLKEPYTLYLAVGVFSFNFLFNTLELFWKEHIRQLYDVSSGQFSLHVSHVTTWISIFATVSGLAFSSNLLCILSWPVSFLLTPVLVCSTTFLFFFSASFPNSLSSLNQFLRLSPLQFTILMGDIAVSLSRILKYVLFDLIKELAYLPLKKIERIQAKTVTDGLISRAGKIASSMLHVSLMSLGGTLLDHVFLIHLLCAGISIAWIRTTSHLSRLFILQENRRKE